MGEKPANPWGLYDVHGNVREWTASSIWKSNYSGREAGLTIDPTVEPENLAAAGGRYVIRGGCFWDGTDDARAAFRLDRDPKFGSQDLGFRVLLPAGPAARADRA